MTPYNDSIEAYDDQQELIADLIAALEDVLPIWESGISEPWVVNARRVLARAKATGDV